MTPFRFAPLIPLRAVRAAGNGREYFGKMEDSKDMDILGHIAVIEHAGAASSDELWGDAALYAIFPNLAHCHEWAYGELKRSPRLTGNIIRDSITGHIITDWVIHYGPDLTPEAQRIGWAYQEMPNVVNRMDAFFDGMLSDGVVERDPRDYDTRAHLERDFGHTVAECALDMLTADEVASSSRQETLCRSLNRLADSSFARGLVSDVFARTGGYTREPESKLARTMREYGEWAASIRHPEDLAALTICTKYDWPYDRRCVDRVLDLVKEVSRGLSPAPRQRLINQVVASIERPDRMVAVLYERSAR
jgi:hypothetical protein